MRTALCERLRIDVPIIQAAMGGAVGPKLVAAVSNAGGLGMLVLGGADNDTIRNEVRATKALTRRPFGVNLNLMRAQEERLAVCLAEGVPVISLFWGDPAPLIEQAHAGGAIVLHTCASADEARRVVAGGVDIVVAQGWEAGGHVRGTVSTMALVPVVVDAVHPTPVVAAGAIADGRGLAAALALGAQGACLGTRFLASAEMTIAGEWKQRTVEADALDAVKVTNSERVMPPFSRPHRPAAPRCLRTPLIDQLRDHPEQVDGAELGRQLVQAILDGRGHEYLPFTGQSAGLIRDIVPAAVILERLLTEADAALRTAGAARTAV